MHCLFSVILYCCLENVRKVTEIIKNNGTGKIYKQQVNNFKNTFPKVHFYLVCLKILDAVCQCLLTD